MKMHPVQFGQNMRCRALSGKAGCKAKPEKTVGSFHLKFYAERRRTFDLRAGLHIGKDACGAWVGRQYVQFALDGPNYNIQHDSIKPCFMRVSMQSVTSFKGGSGREKAL